MASEIKIKKKFETNVQDDENVKYLKRVQENITPEIVKIAHKNAP